MAESQPSFAEETDEFNALVTDIHVCIAENQLETALEKWKSLDNCLRQHRRARDAKRRRDKRTAREPQDSSTKNSTLDVQLEVLHSLRAKLAQTVGKQLSSPSLAPHELRRLWGVGAAVGDARSLDSIVQRAVDEFRAQAVDIRRRLDTIRTARQLIGQGDQSGAWDLAQTHGISREALPGIRLPAGEGGEEDHEDEDDDEFMRDSQPFVSSLYDLLNSAAAWVTEVGREDVPMRARQSVIEAVHRECTTHAQHMLSLFAEDVQLDTWVRQCRQPLASAAALDGSAVEQADGIAEQCAFLLECLERYMRSVSEGLGLGSRVEGNRLREALTERIHELVGKYMTMERWVTEAMLRQCLNRSALHLVDSDGVVADSWVDDGFFLLQKSLSRAASTRMSLTVLASAHDCAALLDDILVPACRVATQRAQARRTALERARALDAVEGPHSGGGGGPISGESARASGPDTPVGADPSEPTDLADTLAAMLFSGGEATEEPRRAESSVHREAGSGEKRTMYPSVSWMREDAISALNSLGICSEYALALVARLAQNMVTDFPEAIDSSEPAPASGGSHGSHAADNTSIEPLLPSPSQLLRLPSFSPSFQEPVRELLMVGDRMNDFLREAVRRFAQELVRPPLEEFHHVAVEAESQLTESVFEQMSPAWNTRSLAGVSAHFSSRREVTLQTCVDFLRHASGRIRPDPVLSTFFRKVLDESSLLPTLFQLRESIADAVLLSVAEQVAIRFEMLFLYQSVRGG